MKSATPIIPSIPTNTLPESRLEELISRAAAIGLETRLMIGFRGATFIWLRNKRGMGIAMFENQEQKFVHGTGKQLDQMEGFLNGWVAQAVWGD